MVHIPTEARTLTFNKSNWSGEEVTVKVRKGNTFDYYEYTFYIEDATPEEGDSKMLKVWDQAKSWGEHPIINLVKFKGDNYWMAYHGDILSDCLCREGEDPVEAAYKVLCNVL